MSQSSNYRLTHTPLNSDQILQKVGDPELKFIPYEQLPNLKSLEDLRPATLLLYQLAKVGHFCCIFENQELGPHTINFFDPLGYQPDAQLNLPIEPSRRIRSNQDFTYLLELLSEAPAVVWNQHRYQMKGTSVCGAWCAIRLMCRQMTNDEFWRVWSRVPQRDLMVAKLYQSV